VIATLTSFARFILALALATRVVTVEAPQMHDDRAAGAIAFVAANDPPLFDDDFDGTRTLAVLLATAREESSFNVGALGDHGRAIGLMQVWRRSDLWAPVPNVREGLRQLRVSFAMCPKHPFAPYLSGVCQGGRVGRQSDRRLQRVGAVLAIMGGADLSAAEARR